MGRHCIGYGCMVARQLRQASGPLHIKENQPMLDWAVQARPRGYSGQKGRFILGINQLKAAGREKVVCLAARAALSFTEARRAHTLIYGRFQVPSKRERDFKEK